MLSSLQFPPISQPDHGLLFKEKAIDHLQFRSLCLVNTKQYVEFEENFFRTETFSFNTLDKVLNLFPLEKKTEENSNDSSCSLFVKVNESDMQVKNEGDPLDNSTNVDLVENKNKYDREIIKEEESFSQSTSIYSQSLDGKSNKPKTNLSQFPIFPLDGHPDLDKSLRNELEKIVNLILSNMGKENNNFIETSRRFYAHNTFLLQTYDALIRKYYSLKKLREDIVRYIFRKVLKVMKESKNEKTKVNDKKASLLLFERYFQSQVDCVSDSQNSKNFSENKIPDTLLHCQKKLKNKGMSINFIRNLFSSETFLKDYQILLPNLEQLLREDNTKRLDNLLDVLVQCVKENNFKPIGSLKIYPWLDIWMEDAKNITHCLSKAQNWPLRSKKVKTEPSAE